MEVRMQVIAKPAKRAVSSLRKGVVEHLKDADEGTWLRLKSQQKPGRSPGWAKIEAVPKMQREGYRGVIKIEWDADQRMLPARVATRGANRPYMLMGLFADYLMAHHADKIHSINMQLL